MEAIVKDIRYAARQMSKNPGFAAVAVLTLALGIGANTAMFSVVDAVLLRPLPFKSPGDLYTLWERNLKMGYEQNPPAAANFRDWQTRNHVFEQLAAFDASRSFDLSGNNKPERVDGAAVSPGLFELLGVAPLVGRTFLPQEDQLGRERVILVSYGLWQSRFNADPLIVGKTISVDGKDFTVTGVMPPGFNFPGDTGTVLNIFTAPRAQVWVPLALNEKEWSLRSAHFLQVIGRLDPGITPGQAQAQMESIEQDIFQHYPKDYVGSDVRMVPLHAQVVGSFRSALLVLFGAVVFVLLIACANIANLMLSRANSRRKEVAIRSSLGASGTRLVRQLLTESITLAMAGGILGLLLAFWGVRLLKTVLPSNFPRTDDIHFNTAALVFTAVVSLATGILFGLAPAFRSSRVRMTESLKDAERGSEGIGRSRLRGALVIFEVALAVILLIGTGLLLRSFSHLMGVDPGFKSVGILTMEISLPDARYPDPQKVAFFSQLLDNVRSFPGVENVGAIGHLPLNGDIESYDMQVVGRAHLPNEYSNPSNHVVMPGYFETMKIPLLEGRLFSASDNAQAPHVLIINDVVARNVFPDENPIGKRLQLGFNNFSGEIIGIVRHTSHLSLDYAPVEEVYAPYLQAPFWSTLSLTIRTASAPLSLAPSIQALVRSMDNDQPVSKIRTMAEITESSVAAPRFRTLLLALFGFTALLLGTLGIYGVMSYSVSHRTREVGIRMALGAAQPQVIRQVLGEGLRLALVGLGLGLIGSLALTRSLASMLYEVRPTDPLTFVGVSLFLLAVSMLANYLPARRAAKVDPMVALRYE